MTKKPHQVEFTAAQTIISKLSFDTQEKLAEAIGCTGSAISFWRSQNSIPKTAYMALECLLRRSATNQGPITTPPTQVLVIRAEADKLAAIELLLESMRVKAAKV